MSSLQQDPTKKKQINKFSEVKLNAKENNEHEIGAIQDHII